MRFLFLLFLALSWALVACSDEDTDPIFGTATPTPTPNMDCRMPIGGLVYPATPPPTDPPDPNLTPTPTPTITPIPLPGTPTATPTPTVTPTPLPWCTPTPTPYSPPPPPPPPAPPPPPGSGGGGGPVAATDGSAVTALSISPHNQEVVAAAAASGKIAIAWLEGGNIIISTSRGEALPAVSRVAAQGNQPTLAFSRSGQRLHMAYVQNGMIHYRNAENINLLAQADEDVVNAGAHPALVVDRQGFAHLLYIEGDVVFHRRQEPGDWRPATIVGGGDGVTAAATEQGHIVAAVSSGEFVRVYRLDGNNWSERAQYHADGTVRGAPQIDAGGDWVYISWVTEQIDPASNEWPRRRPEYKPAAPFVNRIHSGDNAQQYFTTYGVHMAGVYQRFSTSAGAALSASAYFMAWSCEGCDGAGPGDGNPPSIEPANMRVQICIDPAGGVDPLNPLVVCSGPNNALDSWSQISVSATAVGSAATLFLKSNPDLPRQNNDVYWDSASLSGGTLINAGFEGNFPEWQGIGELKVAEGWTPFYVEDSPPGVSSGRYNVYAAWSGDEGGSWQPAHLVAQNAQGGRDKTGTIGPLAFPVIEARNDLVAIVFIFNEGDPTFSGGTIRYGRPSVVLCALGQTSCSPGESGARLVPANLNRPAVNLAVGAANGMAVVSWDAYQGALAQNRDAFATTFTPSSLSIHVGGE